MLGIFAGYRTIILAGLVLGAIGIGYLTIQRIQDTGRQELQIEQLQDQIDLRKRIDDAVRTSPTSVDAADRVLNEFLNSNR